jgi:hypothetical protein
MVEAFLMTAGFALVLYALAAPVWTIVLLKRWLGNRSRPPVTIANLVFGWPVYLASGFAWLVRHTGDTMNVQRFRLVVALAAAVAVLCLLLFAPWVTHSQGHTYFRGRASVFGHGPQGVGWIATGELAVEVGAVLGVAGLLLAVIPRPR